MNPVALQYGAAMSKRRDKAGSNLAAAFCLCVLPVGLMLGTYALLDLVLPGDTRNAVTRQVDGGIEFSIASFKSAWLGIAFILSLFLYPTLVFWWFWNWLSAEYYRIHGKTIDAERGSFSGRIIAYVFVAGLVAFAILMIAVFVVARPLSEVYRITTLGGNVYFESLYRSWNVARRDIRDIDLIRYVDDGRGGSYAVHGAVIHTAGGNQFRTVRDLRARPPDGQQNKQYEKFFSELRTELTKNP